MNANGETVRLIHTPSKILLEYDVSVVREILDLIRFGTDTFAAETLQSHEHQLIEAYGLDQTRARERQEEIERQKIEGDLT